MSALPPDLGPYRIVRLVGRGGMGVVYEAVHTGLDKRVALKVLQTLAGGRLDRFLREARTAAALHHTNIVPVFDAGQVHGVPYYAMQFIDGRPLDTLLRPPAESLPVTAPHVEADPSTADPPADPVTHTVPRSIGHIRTIDPATADWASGGREPPEPPPLRPLPSRERAASRSEAGEGTATKDDPLTPPRSTGRPSPSRGEGEEPVAPARLDPKTVAGLGLQAAEGLAYAHERGVVHRDIKPANLILDSAGVVWVADFGLAFQVDDTALTTEGAILGTPRYMSPEQARGERTDPRTDVCSLGITLYELLTGTAAYAGTTLADTLRRVQTHTPPPPRALNRAVPRDLETVVLKAMAKRPADRYATGREFADDLRRFVAGEPVTARRIGPVGRGWRWAKRNPAVASLLAAVLVVFAAGAGVSAYYAGRAADREADANQNAATARANETAATAERDKVLAAEASNRRLVYAARMNLAGIALRDFDLRRVSELLRETYPGPGEEDLRGWEWHALFRLAHPPVRTLPLPEGGEVVAFGPSRLTMRFGDEVRVLDNATLRVLRTAKLPAGVDEKASWSEDGRWVVYQAGPQVVVYDLEQAAENARFDAPPAAEVALAWMSDGGVMALRQKAEAGQTCLIYDATARKRVCTLAGSLPAPAAVDTGQPYGRMSPDGKFFVAWSGRRLDGWNGRTGDKVSDVHWPVENDPMPTGRSAVGLGPGGWVVYYDQKWNRQVGVLPEADQGEPPDPPVRYNPAFSGFDRGHACFSRDGRKVATVDVGGTAVRVIDPGDPAAAPPIDFRLGEAGAFAGSDIRFDPSGERLYIAGSRSLRVVELGDWLAAYPRPRPPLPGSVFPEGWATTPDEESPCGRWVALMGRLTGNGYAQSLEVWDRHKNRRRLLLSDLAGDQTTSTAWSPDGSRLTVHVTDGDAGPWNMAESAVGGAAVVAARFRRPPSLHLIDPAAGRVLATAPSPLPTGERIEYTPCGRWIVLEDDRNWVVLDSATLAVHLRSDRPAEVSGRAIRGERLIYLEEMSDYRCELTVWDLATRARLSRRSLVGRPAGMVVAPGGEWVVCERFADGEGAELAVFDLADQAIAPRKLPYKEKQLSIHRIGGTVDPRGRWLVWKNNDQFLVYDPATWSQVISIRERRHGALATTPDGRLIALGSDRDATSLMVWDLETGRQLLDLRLDGIGSLRSTGGKGTVRLEYESAHGPEHPPPIRFVDGTPVPDAEARRRLGLSPPP